MKKRWIKNGVFASDTIKLNGCVVCNPTENMLRQAGYEEYQEPEPTDEGKLVQAKQSKLQEIEAYDQSEAVNSFMLNGKARWLSVSKRQSIAYTTKLLKEKGYGSVTIWFDGDGTPSGEGKTESETIPVDQALDMLDTLEIYAKETNNVTHQNKAEVQGMEDISEVEAFDVTKGYPTKLEYNF